MIDCKTALAHCQDLVALAQQMGADAADAIARANSSESVSMRLGKLEEVERSESEEIGLRVFVGKRSASINTSDFAPDGLKALAQRAVEMARHAPEDQYAGLAPSEALFSGELPDLDLDDPERPEPQSLREAALATEEAARAVEGVTNSNGGSAGFDRSVVALVTSNGFARSYSGSGHSLSASVIAGEGGAMETDYASRGARFRSDLPSEAEVGEEAGRRAVARLNAGSMPSGKYPVVFDPRIGGGLIGHLLGAIGAPAVARKSTFMLGREDEELFDPAIRILEEPLRVRGVRSRPFDGEGIACIPRAIIDRGRLTGWLTNVASAEQLGLGLTGHAARASGGSPGVSASNVHLEGGSAAPEGLMADIEDGLYVTGLYGQGVNMVTGDYSRGATGFRIRNGEIARAVSEITIAGHLVEMFRALTPANDLEMYRSVNVPTLRIDGMTVAGE